MPPPVAAGAPAMRRTWPTTAMLVGLACLLMLTRDSAPRSRLRPPSRTLGPANLFVDLTWLNWGTAVVLFGGAVATHLLGGRDRHTELGSAT